MRYYERACKLYEELVREADASGQFIGSLVRAYDKTKMSRADYTRLYELLAEDGAIEIQYRGTRGNATRLRVIRPPLPENFAQAEGVVEKRLTTKNESATVQLEQRITQLERRLQGIDVAEALLNLDQRLTRLEEQESG